MCPPQRMGDCGVQSAEARLAASVWAGSAAALKQALPFVPQGVERLVDGACRPWDQSWGRDHGHARCCSGWRQASHDQETSVQCHVRSA
eukprot:10681532-Alexandrium_andersonii.AAC.1